MEDYKEKYEQALERARKLITLPDDKAMLEEIFPELKESEDEQHRKWILDYLYDGLRKSDEQFKGEFKCAISWLEKQSEQKPDFCHHEVDLSDCSEEYRKAYYDGWNNCNQQHAQLEAEQKPAWSEEDEYNLNWIINDYERASQTAISSVWEGRFKMFVDWLKSLKERYTWKPSGLPHWKKSTLSDNNTTGFNSENFCYKGYYINYREIFEKLPKDN